MIGGVDVFALPAHSVAGMFPAMSPAEYGALVQSVAAEGVLSPVLVWRGRVVDGSHRLRAARDCGLAAADVPVADISDLGAAAMIGRVVAANIERRHLSQSQLAAVADGLSAGSSWGGRREPGGGGGDDDVVRQSDAAAACGVSPASVSRARRVRVEGAPELAAAVAGGEVSVAAAVRVMEVVPAPADQVAVLKRWRAETAGRAGRLGLGGDSGGLVSAAGHWVREQQRAAPKPDAPGGEYGVVVMDPPWPLVTLPQVRGGEVGATYSSLSIDEIREYRPPVGAPGWVFLWCIDRHLWAGRELLADWGLEYSGLMVWHKNGGVKRPDGWTGNGEFVLFGASDPEAALVIIGRAGSPRYGDSRRFFSVMPPWSANEEERAAWKRRGHSEKPDGFFSLVERVCGNVSRLEMYGRRPRPGWDVWGDQSGGGAIGVVGGQDDRLELGG